LEEIGEALPRKTTIFSKNSENETAHITTNTAISNANNRTKIQPPHKKEMLALKRSVQGNAKALYYSPYCKHTTTARGGNHQQQQQSKQGRTL